MATIKIKPQHESQGTSVLIEEEDFNAEVHQLYEEAGQVEGGQTVGVSTQGEGAKTQPATAEEPAVLFGGRKSKRGAAPE